MAIARSGRCVTICVVALASTVFLVPAVWALDLVPAQAVSRLPGPAPERDAESVLAPAQSRVPTKQTGSDRGTIPEQGTVPTRDRARISDTVSRKTKEFLSDPARTGSLVGTIIAGAAVANPLAPLVGSVLGFMIGKRSSYTDKQEAGSGRSVARRGFVPAEGEVVQSIAGLSSGSSGKNTSQNPSVEAAFADNVPNPFALTDTRERIAPAIVATGEPSIGLAVPRHADSAGESDPGSQTTHDTSTSEVRRQIVIPETEAQDGPLDVDGGTTGRSVSESVARRAVPETSTVDDTADHVAVIVSDSAVDGSDEPLAMNRSEPIGKTDYGRADIAALQHLRRQLAESCRNRRYEKPASARCYYLTQ